MPAHLRRESELTRGKTKVVWKLAGRLPVEIQHLDDITAGDGKKHDILPGKAELSNYTNSRLSRLLLRHGVLMAFIQTSAPDAYLAHRTEMIPLEVVVRRRARGSYCKRNPGVAMGQLIEELEPELYLKTKGRRFGKLELPCDDPLLISGPNLVSLGVYRPDLPLTEQQPIGRIWLNELSLDPFKLGEIKRLAIRSFQILEQGWAAAGVEIRNPIELDDWKSEYGYLSNGNIVLSDALTNDEHRLRVGGEEVSKERYRQGASISETLMLYERVADLSERLPL
jgi:phosphoribosylaminoimidazole-succinocarboxamide synthase